MRSRTRAIVHAALLVLAAAPAVVHATPLFVPIARGGDAFPGRPGYTYPDGVTSPFIGARSIDPGGDIYFQARAVTAGGGTTSDLLVYRRTTGQVEPYARSGESVAGVPAVMSWGAVGGHQAGEISHLARLQDGTPGDAAAVLVTRADGSHFVAARQGQQPPGYAQPSAFTTVGMASGEFLDVNMNRAGAVSYGGRFRDASNTLRYGYYLTQPNGTPERIIDSTMPVPNHPTANWVASDSIAAPFDVYTPGLDDVGNAYFRAKYREGTTDFRAFYKRTTDGTVTPIADAGSSEPVPGLPGYSYVRFRAAGNNQAGDVAFGATLNAPNGTPFGSGVFSARAGEGLTKVLVHGDPVPGIPEAVDHQPGLMAMSEAGHLLVTVNYFLGGLGGQSLVLFNPDGSGEAVLRFNETPGFPGERAGLTSQADLNSRGDAIFITSMNTSAQNLAAFAYLNDTDELVPILKTGDTLDGQTVLSFDLGGGATDVLGSIGASGGPVSWDDARNLSMSVLLRDAAGSRRYALYAVQVPEPAGAALVGLAAWVVSRWRLSVTR